MPKKIKNLDKYLFETRRDEEEHPQIPWVATTRVLGFIVLVASPIATLLTFLPKDSKSF